MIIFKLKPCRMRKGSPTCLEDVIADLRKRFNDEDLSIEVSTSTTGITMHSPECYEAHLKSTFVRVRSYNDSMFPEVIEFKEEGKDIAAYRLMGPFDTEDPDTKRSGLFG